MAERSAWTGGSEGCEVAFAQRVPAWRRALLGLVLGLGLIGAMPLASAPVAPAMPLMFERVGDVEQVPEGVVTGLAQDGQGLLWIATTGGLVRYDGYRFRLYQTQPDDPASLPGNVVRVMHRDRDGRIWVGTESEGVARYDPATDRFERFGEAEGVQRLPIRALADDAEGGIWIGSTGGGLTRLDPSKRRSEVWRHAPASATSSRCRKGS